MRFSVKSNRILWWIEPIPPRTKSPELGFEDGELRMSLNILPP